jgi:hypothetical protein
VLDEVGYYWVNGMAIMAAQGRSLGFSLVFATQDTPAMLRETAPEPHPAEIERADVASARATQWTERAD